MNNNKKIVIVIIILLIAAIHLFRLGSYLTGDLRKFYYSYFSDIIIPFGYYFLLIPAGKHFQILNNWKLRAFIVFCLALSAEIIQGFGVYFFGRTFDPLDILAYLAGILFAIVTDKVFFKFQ